MSRCGPIVAALVFAGLASMPVVARQDPGPAFRTAVDAVRVDVAVHRSGRPVSGLRAEDFELTDNGVPQEIRDVTFEKSAIDVTVALDLSRSVSGETLMRLRQGIDRLESRLRADDRMKVVTFSMRIRRLMDFSESRERANDVLATVAAGGATSLADTLTVLLTSAVPPDRRQLIIVFSDGADTASITEEDTLMAVARRTSPTVAFVQPGGAATLEWGRPANQSGAPIPDLTSIRPPNVVRRATPLPALYRLLAAETGGQVLPSTPDVLSNAFGRLLDDFRSSYVLLFSPKGVDSSGFHELRVRVRREGSFDVRARRGYETN
jgi:VWFA-related protein